MNIDVTPHVHADREVTLKISMEISSVINQASIGGISQPIIGQKKIEHEIRLKDGESSLIGGIFDDSQTRALSGIPGLAQIPILRYLFGQVTQDKSQDETVFAITPHIIRGNGRVSELNQRQIEIGTANTIKLCCGTSTGSGRLHRLLQQVRRRSTSAPTAQPQAPANPVNGESCGSAASEHSNPKPDRESSAAPGGTNFLFDPGQITAVKGNTFVVNLLISGAQNVYSVPVQMNYDPAKLTGW